jgi:hypothetical protein
MTQGAPGARRVSVIPPERGYVSLPHRTSTRAMTGGDAVPDIGAHAERVRMDSSHISRAAVQTIGLTGTAPTPDQTDHRWELDVRPDVDGAPFVSLSVTSDDEMTLAVLSPEQARLVARTLEECARWIEQER